MASFDTSGLDGLVFSLEEVGAMPDELIDGMLEAGGAMIAEYHKAELNTQGLVDTGALRDSISVHKKRGRDGSRYVLVYPYGNHGAYNRKLVVKAYKRSKHGRTYTIGGDTKEVSNSDVGFVLEFGAPERGIVPRQWMRIANEKGISDVIVEEKDVYEQFLDKLNL